MPVSMRSIGVAIPERRLANEELDGLVDTDDAWIRSHTGIGSRHVAADGVLTSDLAAAAAMDALGKAGLAPGDLDLIVLATATPDYFGFPSTACIVQAKIGASCPAFDLSAGCTGFVYALDVARGMLEADGGSHALVIGAETLTRITNWGDRSTCVLLGDGAGAAVLARSEAGGEREILSCLLEADGSGAADLRLVQAPRLAAFERAAPTVPFLEMNGKRVYDFAVNALAGLVRRLLGKAGLQLGDLKRIVPHQANARIVEAAAKRLGVEGERFFLNIGEYANTSSASIPIALNELSERGLLERGDAVMLVGFGAGLTCGGSLLRW